MSSEAKTHPYHMVKPSPWPIASTLGTLLMAFGGIWYMQKGPMWLLLTGLAILLFSVYGWRRDVISEAQNGVDHTDVVQHGLRVGMVLFIISEVMFFFAFFWAYFNSSVPALSQAALEVWPPEGIETVYTWGLPFVNTVILLTSGATLTMAHHGLRENDSRKLKIWLLSLDFLFGNRLPRLSRFRRSSFSNRLPL